MTSGKVDPVPSYDNSVKAWPQNLLSSSLTYTAQTQPVLSVPNSVVVPPETASSRQNTYMNSAVVPGKNDSTNLPIFITKRRTLYWNVSTVEKQTPPKREGPSQGSEFSTMEPPNGEDPLKSNIPGTIDFGNGPCSNHLFQRLFPTSRISVIYSDCFEKTR